MSFINQVKQHRTTILVSAASFLLGAVCLFAGLKAAPSLSAKMFPAPAFEQKQPGKGMAWLQPAPPPLPSGPLAGAGEDDEKAMREEMEEAEKQMQAMRRQFFGGTDPFEEARRMHGGLLRGFPGMAITMGGEDQEIVEKEDDKAVYYEISGVDQTKLSTKVEDGMLTIEGRTKQEKGQGGFRATMQSSFHRSFPLPPNVDERKMEMSSEGDKVILKFPKRG